MVMNLKSILFAFFLCASATTIWLGYSWYNASHHAQKQQATLTRYEQELKTELVFKKILQISLALFFALCLLILFIGTTWCTKQYHWWILVTILSLLCLAEIAVFWFLNSERQLQKHANHLYIANQQGLDNFLTTNNAAKQFTAIPTGIFIEHVQFCQKENSVYPGIVLSGYIWQQYTNGIHDGLERAILLPDMHYGTLEKLSTTKTAAGETVCWAFSGIFFQYFDLAYYPFDHRHVQIQILPKNFERNVICIPDFSTYTLSDNHKLLGMNADILITDWTLKRSFFSYSIRNFGCSLGAPNFLSSAFPQCYFYFILKRDLLDTFIFYLLIILITIIMFFVTLVTFDRREKTADFLGFSVAGTVGIISAILFVLLTSHIALRESLGAEGVIYLDYIYMICYLFGVGITIDGLRCAFHKNVADTAYHTMIIKLLYWPLFLFSVLGVTVLIFY